jgi:hypothetical protein
LGKKKRGVVGTCNRKPQTLFWDTQWEWAQRSLTFIHMPIFLAHLPSYLFSYLPN